MAREEGAQSGLTIMQLNDEQIEAHFRAFCAFFEREVVPDLKPKSPMSDYELGFAAGRCFEKLWQETLIAARVDYAERSGQLDL